LYQVDATELIAEASEVDSAAGIDKVVSMYAEIAWPLKHVKTFPNNILATYTSRDVSWAAALVRAHSARVVMDPNLILA
jgi:hypothetical protein